MDGFKEFVNNQLQQQQQDQLWKATKENIIKYWRELRQDTPIQITPISYQHKGSTYGEDGIRITGSPVFIGTVLSRLKEILNYENSNTKLNLTFRQTKSPSQSLNGLGKTSYVFYVSSKERGKER